ncbi:MAG: hypothetical protein FWD62_13285 [Betaproteobacteria bacterium]|nr:hypothetical protein [Betaproteobacteria bacterium]
MNDIPTKNRLERMVFFLSEEGTFFIMAFLMPSCFFVFVVLNLCVSEDKVNVAQRLFVFGLASVILLSIIALTFRWLGGLLDERTSQIAIRDQIRSHLKTGDLNSKQFFYILTFLCSYYLAGGAFGVVITAGFFATK